MKEKDLREKLNEDKNEKSEDLVLKDIKEFMLKEGGHDLDELNNSTNNYIPKREHLAPKGSDNDINGLKKLIEENPILFPEPDRTKFLNLLEVEWLIKESLPPLQKKVEFLRRKKTRKEIIKFEKTLDYLEKAATQARDPRIKRLSQNILEFAKLIIREDKNKRRASDFSMELNSNYINIVIELKRYLTKFEYILNPQKKVARQIDPKILKKYKYICENCGSLFRYRMKYCLLCRERLRPMKDYLETMKSKSKEFLPRTDKFRTMVDTLREILEAIMKLDEEHEKLLDRKNMGVYVDHLIAENRRERERLEKEEKEKSEIMNKWVKSEEGRKLFEAMAMVKTMTQFNPYLKLRSELRSKISDIEKKIKQKEQEYKELVERKNKGEYVEDLINQNRYTIQSLEKDKKKMEDTLGENKEKSD